MTMLWLSDLMRCISFTLLGGDRNGSPDMGGGGAQPGDDHAGLQCMVEEYLFDLLGLEELREFFCAYAAAVGAADSDAASPSSAGSSDQSRAMLMEEDLLRLCEQRCVAFGSAEGKFEKLRAALQVPAKSSSRSVSIKGIYFA